MCAGGIRAYLRTCRVGESNRIAGKNLGKEAIMKTSPSIVAAKSIWKYLLWSCIAAVVQELINQLPGVQLPPYALLIIAAGLKGLASWVETRRLEAK